MKNFLLTILFIANLFITINSISDEKKAQCLEYLNNYMSEHQIVGLALGLSENGYVSWLQGLGYADLQAKEPINPTKTLIRWASMSKQLTSILAVKLQSLGYLDLDKDISTYYKEYVCPSKFLIKCDAGIKKITYNGTEYRCQKSPDFKNYFALIPIPDQNRSITLRQLLSHFAGIESYTDGFTKPQPPNSILNDPYINDGVEWALEYFKDFPLIHIPDQSYNYTTFGFDLAGVVVSKAHGGRFEDLIQAAILESVYTEMPSMVPDKIWLAQFRPQRAQGYINPNKISPDNDVSYKLPGGGYMSTVEDAVRFVTHYRNNSILSEEQKLIVWTPPHPEQYPYYGLGFEVNYYQGKLQYVGHTGAQEKARTIMRYYLEQDVGVSIMSNSENFDSSGCLNGLMKIIFSNSTSQQQADQKNILLEE